MFSSGNDLDGGDGIKHVELKERSNVETGLRVRQPSVAIARLGKDKKTANVKVDFGRPVSEREIMHLEEVLTEASEDIKGYVKHRSHQNKLVIQSARGTWTDYTSFARTASVTYVMGGLVAVVVCTIASFISFHYATYDGSAVRGGRLLDAQGNVAATATASRNVNLDSLLSSVAGSVSSARMLRRRLDSPSQGAVASDGTQGSAPNNDKNVGLAFLDRLLSLTITMSNGETRECKVEGHSLNNDATILLKCIGGASVKWSPKDKVGPINGTATAENDGVGTDSNGYARKALLGTWWSNIAGDPNQKKTTCVKVMPKSECSKCVEQSDLWCSTHAWDSFCKQHCLSSTCKEACQDKPVTIAAVNAVLEEMVEVVQEQKKDCLVSEWSPFSKCEIKEATCVQRRSREVTHFAEHDGAQCPVLEEEVACECPVVCGDGRLVEGKEACDDGNIASGDGCSSSCEVEVGYRCSGEFTHAGQIFDLTGNLLKASTCVNAACGDGIVIKHFEECDDGNNVNGDGCSSTCSVEPYHECAIKGKCANNEAPACQRVRRDYADLKESERTMYITAIQKLKASGVYDKFVQVHAHDPNKDYAHGTSGFLPWHRKYLLEFENALRSIPGKDPSTNQPYSCLTIPYWDWSEETELCIAKGGCATFDEKSQILKDFGGTGDGDYQGLLAGQGMCNATDGCGLWGSVSESQHAASGPNLGCVMKGPFAGWVDHDGYCLTRGTNWAISTSGTFTGAMATKELVISNEKYGTFSGFRARWEGAPHANPHNLLGGHIRSFSSPADPIFFSHHSYIDKVWALWQDCHDHDSIHSSKITKAQYDGTTFGVDGVDDPMVLEMPLGKSEPGAADKCSKADATGCSTCVHRRDSWCKSNAWDSQCESFCTGSCKSSCGGSSAEVASQPGMEIVRALTNKTADAIESWDASKAWTPRDFHSVLELGYNYALDSMDKHLTCAVSTCNLDSQLGHLRRLGWSDVESRLQSTLSSRTRHVHDKMLAASRTRDEHDKADKVLRARERRLEGEATKSACTSSKDQSNACLVEKVSTYFCKLFADEKSKSIMIDDASKAKDAIPKMTERECAILQKGGHEITTELDKRWWALWGKENDDWRAMRNPCGPKTFNPNGTACHTDSTVATNVNSTGNSSDIPSCKPDVAWVPLNPNEAPTSAPSNPPSGNCPSGPILTAIFDGIDGDKPKGVEIFIPSAGNYSAFSLKKQTNGKSSWEHVFTFSASEMKGNLYISPSDSRTILESTLSLSGSFVSSPLISINGNDAVAIFKGSTLFDIYGEASVDGSGKSWEYTDSLSTRKSETQAGTSWKREDWVVKGKDYLDGVPNQATELIAGLGKFSLAACA